MNETLSTSDIAPTEDQGYVDVLIVGAGISDSYPMVHSLGTASTYRNIRLVLHRIF